MKAVVYRQFGSPDVLQVEEIQKPTPKPDEVLVKIEAASVNAADWHLLRAEPFIIRFAGFGFLKPKHTILGSDIAGRVEAVGENVTSFKPGDEVFGDISGCGLGGFAEYVCTCADMLTLKPEGISFEEAAAVPLAAVTALHGLRDFCNIGEGKKVLINGASGGVGSFAVQIAKAYGAEVTGVCSTRKMEMVRSIGADHIIDHTKEDFTKNGQQYDIIFDTAAHHSMFDYKRSLNEGGTYLMVGGDKFLQALILGPSISLVGDKKLGTMTNTPNRKDLEIVRQMIEEGKIKPVIDRTFSLDQTADAIRYLEDGHAQGKVIIKA